MSWYVMTITIHADGDTPTNTKTIKDVLKRRDEDTVGMRRADDRVRGETNANADDDRTKIVITRIRGEEILPFIIMTMTLFGWSKGLS